MADLVNIDTTDIEQSNCSVVQLEALDANLQVFVAVIYCTTAVLAFFGNVVVICVEINGKRSAQNLRKFLINLAISDIIIGVFNVPFSYTSFMLGRWIFPSFMCNVAQFVQLLNVFFTAMTLSFIGIERYKKIYFSRRIYSPRYLENFISFNSITCLTGQYRNTGYSRFV